MDADGRRRDRGAESDPARALPRPVGMVPVLRRLRAGVVSDALYHRRPNSGLVDFATAALALAGIVMVAVSVWMAIGSQLRRMR